MKDAYSAQQIGAPEVFSGGGEGLHSRLTPRQLEVLSLLGEGLPNKLICRQLNISPGTVKAHISCILRELGVSSRLQAVVAAQRLGLLGDPTAEAQVGVGTSGANAGDLLVTQ
jgi:DNA-binding NarL/FixJ family response regulator